jgi:hypothetical protein
LLTEDVMPKDEERTNDPARQGKWRGRSKSHGSSGSSKPGGGARASGGQSTRGPTFGERPDTARASKRAGTPAAASDDPADRASTGRQAPDAAGGDDANSGSS